MATINEITLVTLIQAVQIAMEYYANLISHNQKDDVADYEESYMSLEKAAEELRRAYKQVRREDPSWMPYEELIQAYSKKSSSLC